MPDITDREHITLAHGSGGTKMHELIRAEILRFLDSPELARLDDAAELTIDEHRIAFSTDTFVVKPVFFPGGDIGSLAVSGTVNDLLMKGARPLWLSLGLVIEEGFPVEDFRRILGSIRRACLDAGTSVVTGDTKVVGKGDIDGICINTSGIGSILPDISIRGSGAVPGDAVLVSGDIGRHGIAVMAERNHLRLRGNIASDAAPLTRSVIPFLEKFGGAVHALRDPTRGGVATTLNEIADASSATIVLDEASIPVSSQVRAVSDILGFDPLYLPCEGRFLAVIENDATSDALAFLREQAHCTDAVKLGSVTEKSPGEVLLTTLSGGRRILDMPSGELLPRIC